MDGVEYKTVVVVSGERRRPVQFKSSDTPNEEADNLFEAVADCFKDIIDIRAKEGSSRGSEYYLQQESSEWGLIDVNGFVKNKDTINLCCSKTTCAEVCI